MRWFNKTLRGWNLLTWSPALIFILAAAILLAVSSVRIAFRAWNIAGERRALEERVLRLEAEKARLEQDIRILGTTEAVERLAKEKLNLKNPGEEVVVVTPRTSAASTSPAGENFFLKLLPDWILQFISFLNLKP